jgi:hypothetical protein
MANWPFITLIIKGEIKELETIRGIVNKNQQEQTCQIALGSFDKYGEDHNNINEWLKNYYRDAEYSDYNDIAITEKHLKINFRLKNGPDNNFYKFLQTASHEFPRCFFYASWFDIYNSKCGYFFGKNGEIVYQTTGTVERDVNNNFIDWIDNKKIVIKYGEELNPDHYGGYDHIHPINFILEGLI